MKVEPAGQPEATAANASAIDAAPHVVPAEQLADALSCPICLGLLKDPLIAACCHNNFCRQCLKSSLLSKPECPLCRAPLVLENTLPNRAIRNLLPPEAQETADEGSTTFKQTTLLAGGKVPPACVLLLFMLSFASISFAPPRMPCFSTSFRTGGLWECHHASGTEAEPSLRGGRPLEPPVPPEGALSVLPDYIQRCYVPLDPFFFVDLDDEDRAAGAARQPDYRPMRR